MKIIFTILFLIGCTVSLYADGMVEKIIVMDMSGSMYGKIGDTLKIKQARDTAKKILDNADKNTQIGLVTMGGKRRKGCRNYRLDISPKEGSNDAVWNLIRRTKPRGKTPLSRALQKAVQSLKTPNRAHIVLITDGKERCGSSACNVVKTYMTQYPGLRMDIVSLATEADAEQKLKCMAESTQVNYREIEPLPRTRYKISKTQSSTKKSHSSVPPQLKLYAALPLDDESGMAVHHVYTKKGILVLECESTQKKECIQSISPGTYRVQTTYQDKSHETKLLILEGMDAFLYTSFRKNSIKETETYADNVSEVEPERFDEENREIFVDERVRERMMDHRPRKRKGGYLF